MLRSLAPWVVGILLVLAARPTVGRTRVAIPELVVEGDHTPGVEHQLQDGFVLALVRLGVHVMDPMDVAKRLEATPELRACDSSPCLKALGQMLDVQYVLSVRVTVAGNSYRMVVRLYPTDGAIPAALPMDTQSRTCDVCTIAEARNVMMRLGDTLRGHFDETPAAAPPPPPPAPPEPKRSIREPLAAAIVGGVIALSGLAMLVTMDDCSADGSASCRDVRLQGAIAGGLIGAGVVTAGVGGTLTYVRSRTTSGPVLVAGLHWRF